MFFARLVPFPGRKNRQNKAFARCAASIHCTLLRNRPLCQTTWKLVFWGRRAICGSFCQFGNCGKTRFLERHIRYSGFFSQVPEFRWTGLFALAVARAKRPTLIKQKVCHLWAAVCFLRLESTLWSPKCPEIITCFRLHFYRVQDLFLVTGKRKYLSFAA